ncbi:transcription antitermination factor NusB [Bacillus fonticola]|uniref:transcription antitermination factor NusB n=1 Tax=Bacillus fonticola TaxID=2728853 RepID=UPI00147286F0|nr:transcription antitermination factor NusB [Bacillus fonticola]
MKRHEARKKALQALYQIDITEHNVEEALHSVVEEGESPDGYLHDLVCGVIENRAQIDEWLEAHLEKWKLTRVGVVERNALRIGAYELKYSTEVPANVAMNEAIEVAKTFGDEQSGKFVNGVLSKLKRSLDNE